MEVTARLRYAPGSAQKMRLVADLIRGKGVQDAVNLLGVTNKAAARHVQKCLKSAIANAENREDHVDVDRLYVKEIFVDGGRIAKRVRPAPMGRAFRILRRQSHITIKLDTRKGDGKKYKLALPKASITDYANYGKEFEAPKEWTGDSRARCWQAKRREARGARTGPPEPRAARGRARRSRREARGRIRSRSARP